MGGSFAWPDKLGTYPAAITGGNDGYDKRTERMEGWNDAVTEYITIFMKLQKWHSTIPASVLPMVDDLLLNNKLDLRIDYDVCVMWVDCSDTFAWGCSDGED